MAGRIRDEDIAAVRERSPIDEVIGEYLQLRSAGGESLKGLCPFHDEKTPSFNVTPSRGLFYCFSCAEGGDVIKFVQLIDGLTFVEAIERLAGRAGIDLRYEQGGYVPGQEQSRRRRLIDAHRLAAEFYAEQLQGPGAATGRAFLSERGFERADAERFGVGYAPAAWEELTRHLRARGFSDDELIAGGLARKGQRGARDMFHGRLIWPIRDLSGDVIAFGARKLSPDEDGPKYLNTPETQLFQKKTVLYGADLAKREISHRRQAVIVEGYTDVMACHLAGVPTAVATCGTSFGEEHIKVLRRLVMDTDGVVGEVIFTFDGDAAGQKAALRAFSLEERFVTQTFVSVQPDGLDPRRAGQPQSGHGRRPDRRAGRGGPDRGPDQGFRAPGPLRRQPGSLARPDGRAVRAGPDPGARWRRTGRSGPQRPLGAAGSGVVGRAAPGRRGAQRDVARAAAGRPGCPVAQRPRHRVARRPGCRAARRRDRL
jgi:DNA primase